MRLRAVLMPVAVGCDVCRGEGKMEVFFWFFNSSNCGAVVVVPIGEPTPFESGRTVVRAKRKGKQTFLFAESYVILILCRPSGILAAGPHL